MIKRGEVWQIGKHRLMCGDATSKTDVAKLFAGGRPTLVVTSPPYAKQRAYDRPIKCWDSLMMGALNGHNFSADVQMLVNLGVIHISNEWLPYWHTWIANMRANGWRHYSSYVWDKGIVAPGNFHGRLCPSFEFVHHLNKKTVNANKWQPCRDDAISRQGKKGGSNIVKKCGAQDRRVRTKCYNVKVPRNVISAAPVRQKEATGHPAQMPLQLASFLLRTWAPQSLSYDPFCGSGTTLLACELENVKGLGMEISEEYCAIAINRWNKAHPDVQAVRL